VVNKRNYTKATEAALFALSAKCYFPRCKQPSVTFFGDDPDKKVQIAHIHAVSSNGPRYKVMTPEENRSFRNLILLCDFHHGIVDKKANEAKYPARDLFKWKVEAEKDMRSKVDGLDRLTEDRLGEMLATAAYGTKEEIEKAIDLLKDVSEGAAEVLRTMFDKIETHYLDADAVATLDAVSHRLGDLSDNAHMLHSASHRLGDLTDNVHMLASTSRALADFGPQIARLDDLADRLAGNGLSTTPDWFDEFRYEYNLLINSRPDTSDVVDAIEYAGQRAVAQIRNAAESVDIGEPPIVVDHPQKWKYFIAGMVFAALLVIAGVVLVKTGTMR
jgi:hypothetical protein